MAPSTGLWERVTEPNATAALLGVLGLLLIVAAVMSPLSSRLGVPALLLFLIVGIAAGSEGIGGIPFDDTALAFRLGSVALVLILFDGGLNTDARVFRRAFARAAALASVGVAVTALAVAGVGLLLGLAPPLALLVGAVVSSTDAAAVFSVLRGSGIRLRESTAATLEVESGLNDPMAVFLTVVTTELALGAAFSPGDVALHFLRQIGIGAAAGVAFGVLGRALLRTVTLPAAGLYPVLTTAIAFVSFGVPTLLDGSGFLSTYLTAIWLAAGPLPYRAGVRRVHDALAWLSQLAMFVMLGLLVFPSRLLENAASGLVIALALAFVARPLAVIPLLAGLRMPLREQLFVAWVGLRGAVPIVLASYPLLRGVAGGDAVFHLVFFVVLVNALVPGATVPWLARRLGLATAGSPPPAASVEVVSLRELPGEFLWLTVAAPSAVAGARIQELPLPEGCVLAIVVRGAEVIAPRGHTELRVGDQVCVFATPESRPMLGLLFGALEAGGP